MVCSSSASKQACRSRHGCLLLPLLLLLAPCALLICCPVQLLLLPVQLLLLLRFT
jgi:hypothetical protein